MSFYQMLKKTWFVTTNMVRTNGIILKVVRTKVIKIMIKGLCEQMLKTQKLLDKMALEQTSQLQKSFNQK